jgi:spore maturation protein CgeB
LILWNSLGIHLMTLFIVGGTGGTNIGDSFFREAQRCSLSPVLFDSGLAYQAPKWLQYASRYLMGNCPARLNEFSQELLDACLVQAPQWLITLGIAPVSASVLREIGRLGICRINFLTDDPWNSAHRSSWFQSALPHYDMIFSPRRANIDDLLKAGCQKVEYLPFGYDPDLFYADPIDVADELRPDVMFAGGADRDRVPYMDAIAKAGMSLRLHGCYWERFPETKALTQGQANAQTLRVAIQHAKIALCLVRRANRDGHCMRTFEVPAIGTCMLTEDTPEHREIFGQEGQAVVYFRTLTEMVEKAQWLLSHESERRRLARSAHQLITQGSHTYGDRLQTILSSSPVKASLSSSRV